MSRHAGRLPKEVRIYLYKALLYKKTRDHRPLSFPEEHAHASLATLYTHFETFYFGRNAARNVRPPLFLQLHDIPWETHVLRAIDFVHPGRSDYRCIDTRAWLIAAIRHAAPGRSLYELALEFHYWRVRSPNDRLSAAIRLLEGTELLPQRVRAWLSNTNADVEDSINALYKEIRAYLCRGETYRELGLRDILRDARFSPRVLLLAHPYNLADRRRMRNTDMVVLEYLQGQKLEQLLEIMKDMKEEGVRELEPLATFLELRTNHLSTNGPFPQRLRQILHAFARPPNMKAAQEWKKTLPDIAHYSLSRMGISGAHDYRRGRAQTLVENVVRNSAWSEAQAYEPGAWNEAEDVSNARLFQCVLGTNDIIGLSQSPPLRRWTLPHFLPDEGKHAPPNETFLPFFERRERAFLLQPGKRANGGATETIKEPSLAFISVCLSQRAVRIDFLWRLLTAIAKRGTDPSRLESAGGFFDPSDTIYLGQGWGDVIISFSATRNPRLRLGDVFRIQNVLYEDFMVDRTEIILSSECLALAAKAPGTYKVIVQCKVKEGSYLGHSNEDFTRAIRGRIQGKGIEVFRTPGRTDFLLVFNDWSLFQRHRGNPLSIVLGLFGKETWQVDEVVTTIAVHEGPLHRHRGFNPPPHNSSSRRVTRRELYRR